MVMGYNFFLSFRYEQTCLPSSYGSPVSIIEATLLRWFKNRPIRTIERTIYRTVKVLSIALLSHRSHGPLRHAETDFQNLSYSALTAIALKTRKPFHQINFCKVFTPMKQLSGDGFYYAKQKKKEISNTKRHNAHHGLPTSSTMPHSPQPPVPSYIPSHPNPA